MSEEKQAAAGEQQVTEDTDELRPAGEDARVAEAREQKKSIGDENGEADGDGEDGPADSPLAEDPGEEDSGAQS
jgi:hypothetical protein